MLNKYERAAKKFEDAGAIVPVGSMTEVMTELAAKANADDVYTKAQVDDLITPITPQPFEEIATDVSTVAGLRTSVNDLISALATAGVLTVEEQEPTPET